MEMRRAMVTEREKTTIELQPSESSDLLDEQAVCATLGGSRPIHPSTLYRGIRAGTYPKPVKIGKKTNRWLKSEVTAVIAQRAAERSLGM
jgi:predicted DNA-binding transcriptional regulator AlpA